MNTNQNINNSAASSGCPLPSCSDSSSSDDMASVIDDMDQMLSQMGYARAYEEKHESLASRDLRKFVIDFGHFTFEIFMGGHYPKPICGASAVNGATADEFLGKLREGLKRGAQRKPHECRKSEVADFFRYQRSVNETILVCHNDDSPTCVGGK